MAADREKTSGPQAINSSINIALLLLCLAIATFDGFDTQSVAFVGRDIAREWMVAPSWMGMLFSAGMMGGLIGALIAPAASRLGYRYGLALCILVFCVGSTASALAIGVKSLFLMRLFTGIGLGAAIPLMAALITESFPKHFQARAMAIMLSGLTLGGFLGNLLSSYLIPQFGWRVVFLVGGVTPLLLLLPLCRIVLTRNEHKGAEGEREERANIRRLFQQQGAPFVIMLLSGCFCGVFVVYSLLNWMPSVLQMTGFSRDAALKGASLLNAGGTIAMISFGALMDKFGVRRMIGLGFGSGVPLLIALCWTRYLNEAAVPIIFAAGFVVIGAQSGFTYLVASSFPPALRVTALSGALVMARVGAIMGPAIAGLILATGLELSGFFLIMAMISLGACLCAVVKPRDQVAG